MAGRIDDGIQLDRRGERVEQHQLQRQNLICTHTTIVAVPLATCGYALQPQRDSNPCLHLERRLNNVHYLFSCAAQLLSDQVIVPSGITA